jgi:hypothetical protein
MPKFVVGSTLAFLIAMTPLTVMAQANTFDEETIAFVQQKAQEVGAFVAPGSVTGVPDVAGAVDSAPVPETEGAKPEPEDDELPPLNLTDLAEYSSQGVTIQAPADWDVETDFDDGIPFHIEVPGTDLQIEMQSDLGFDFPSLLGVALFRSQADALIEEIGEGAQLEESTTIFSAQNLPIAKMEFSGVDDSEVSAGALFVVAPGNNAFLFLAGGLAEEWAYAEPGVEAIINSITFDDDLLEIVSADGGPLDFTDEDETLQVTVPEGWYAMATGDPQFPVILAEPEVRYIIAVGTEASFGEDFDASALEEMLPESGELTEEQKQDFLDTVIDAVASSGSPIDIDEDSSTLALEDGVLTVHLVGTADLEDFSMPIVFYLSLDQDGAAVAVVFGDTESAGAIEDVTLGVLDSITKL